MVMGRKAPHLRDNNNHPYRVKHDKSCYMLRFVACVTALTVSLFFIKKLFDSLYLNAVVEALSASYSSKIDGNEFSMFIDYRATA